MVIVDSQGQEIQGVSAEQIIRMISEHLLEHVTAIEAIKRQHDPA